MSGVRHPTTAQKRIHFQRRWNERYRDSVGPYTPRLREEILDKIHFGESETVRPALHESVGLLRIEAVEIRGTTVYIVYDEEDHELFSALPAMDAQVRRFIAWKNRLARDQPRKRRRKQR